MSEEHRRMLGAIDVRWSWGLEIGAVQAPMAAHAEGHMPHVDYTPIETLPGTLRRPSLRQGFEAAAFTGAATDPINQPRDLRSSGRAEEVLQRVARPLLDTDGGTLLQDRRGGGRSAGAVGNDRQPF
jgi:hypothetical protein